MPAGAAPSTARSVASQSKRSGAGCTRDQSMSMRTQQTPAAAMPSSSRSTVVASSLISVEPGENPRRCARRADLRAACMRRRTPAWWRRRGRRRDAALGVDRRGGGGARGDRDGADACPRRSASATGCPSIGAGHEDEARARPRPHAATVRSIASTRASALRGPRRRPGAVHRGAAELERVVGAATGAAGRTRRRGTTAAPVRRDGQLPRRTGVGAEERRAHGHRLEQRQAVALVVARPQQAQRVGEEVRPARRRRGRRGRRRRRRRPAVLWPSIRRVLVQPRATTCSSRPSSAWTRGQKAAKEPEVLAHVVPADEHAAGRSGSVGVDGQVRERGDRHPAGSRRCSVRRAGEADQLLLDPCARHGRARRTAHEPGRHRRANRAYAA